MEKGFNRGGKDDWEGPLEMLPAFQFSVSQGTDWLVVRFGETYHLLYPLHTPLSTF